MKALPPSLRKRKRYIAFRFIGTGDIEKSEVSDVLKNTTIQLFGELNAPKLRLIEFDGEAGMVMCEHSEVDKIKITLTLIEEINGKKVIPLILGVAGTIKSCKRKYLEVLRNADSANGV
ncbi:Rpp14/Pop5 family protein [Geoglobus acetivorans]|uniref:Ribonuclease P protein component 2 n=1 Tax=Geoglobus acetivorans TaxID=565033 RepID=A0ABZ3H2E9_GEOAI|nr:ribonuclease P [Geoglobus acetivorans]